MSDWNTKIIEEFRANGGAVGGQFAGAPLLLLHTVGARSGQRRVNPVMYQKVDGGYAVFASKAGAPVNPDWYHNLLAQPQVTAEIGTETVELGSPVWPTGTSGSASGLRRRPPTRGLLITSGRRPARSRSSCLSPPGYEMARLRGAG